MKNLLTGVFITLLGLSTFAQKQVRDRANKIQLNSITTAVPFLNITPDSRSGAMGDVGVALSPDANSMHWNVSKLAFTTQDVEVAVSYSPWLRSLVPDMNLTYLSGYKRLNKLSAIGGSLRYFSLGEINFTDGSGNPLRSFTPTEWALDVGYAMKLSDRLSAGAALRYVRSNLTGGFGVEGANTKPGQSVAFDVSAYYKSKNFKIKEKNAFLSAGLNVSNIGNKMTYTGNREEDFIPSNLRVGTALTVEVDDFNTVTLSADINKLLVPTPNGSLDDSTSNKEVSVLKGVFGSFSDAPGGGSEELKEVNISIGAEYLYQQQLAFRMGYFHEAAEKGDRKFLTLGAGIKFTVFEANLAYLLPVEQNNPLGNTWRITLRFMFDEKSKSKNSGSASPENI